MRLRERLWTVYAPTGDRSRPLKPLMCVRANAKSIAAGKVARLDPRLSTNYSEHGNRIAKARRGALVVVEGCHTGGTVLRGTGRTRAKFGSKKPPPWQRSTAAPLTDRSGGKWYTRNDGSLEDEDGESYSRAYIEEKFGPLRGAHRRRRRRR